MSLVRSTGALMVFAALSGSAAAQQPPSPAQPQPGKPAFEVQVKTTEPVHAVVLAMKGSYLQHPEAFGRLGAYLTGRGIKPAGPPFGRYFSDPSVGEANLVWEIGFPVAAGVAVEAPYEIRDMPATLCASHVHRGPIEELGPAWNRLVEWVMSNGYRPITPAMQVFRGDMAVATEIELLLPVGK